MTEKKAPMVRVGDTWVPAHRIWNVVEAMNTATDLVERFNETRPELTTEVTREVVEVARERIRSMELEMGGPGTLKEAAIAAGVATDDDEEAAHGDNEVAAAEGHHGTTEIAAPAAADNRTLADDDFAEAARQLLSAMSVDEALQMLRNDYDNPVDIAQLAEMVGEQAFRETLTREAQELTANMIAPDQVAELWNESGYPPPVGNLWTEEEVKELLG